jgi:hypothetical protein
MSDPTEPEAFEQPASVGDARPVVLVLGDFTHEGLSAKIESLGFEVVNKRLRSTPKNWLRIVELVRGLRREKRLALVFVYAPTATLLLLAEDQFDSPRPVLLDELQAAKALFFVYEDNAQRIIEPLPWEVDDRDDQTLERLDIPWPTLNRSAGLRTRETWLEEHTDDIERAKALLDELTERGIEIAPFRKRSDVTLRMFEALEEAQAGVFLRLYVPHGRYQSEQFEDFLTLFSRYLREVEGKEFSVDVQRTARGTTYVFKGRGEASSVDDLRAATGRFDSFLTLSQANPGAAEQQLVQSGAPAREAAFIVAKYARSLRRLNMEVRHEFERRRLLLSQSLDSELLDAKDATLLPVSPEDHPSALFAVIGNAAPVTINLPNAVLAHGGAGAVAQVVSGGVTYSSEDKELLLLIESLEDRVEALRLRSELDRLKDLATRPEERRTAAQKLKSFLYRGASYVGRKVDDVGTQLLVAYLDRLVSGKS